MDYFVSEDAKVHLRSHFVGSGKSGSLFNIALFPSEESLLNALITMIPERLVMQSNGREAHEYYFAQLDFSGVHGVGLRKDFPHAAIQTELRNGFDTPFIEVECLPKTRYVTVISEAIDGVNSLITVFPGRYAPPFPYSAMSESELKLARKFWTDHILLKVKESQKTDQPDL